MNHDKYQDTIFEFKGLWDVPSKCGLKVVSSGGKIIVIATELYDENPGTTITKWSAQLATELYNNFGQEPDDFVFIERTPDKKSKLSFYDQSFYKVNYTWTGDKFEDPQWQKLSEEDLESLLNE
jgi:hypothetical protein